MSRSNDGGSAAPAVAAFSTVSAMANCRQAATLTRQVFSVFIELRDSVQPSCSPAVIKQAKRSPTTNVLSSKILLR